MSRKLKLNSTVYVVSIDHIWTGILRTFDEGTNGDMWCTIEQSDPRYDQDQQESAEDCYSDLELAKKGMQIQIKKRILELKEKLLEAQMIHDKLEDAVPDEELRKLGVIRE